MSHPLLARSWGAEGLWLRRTGQVLGLLLVLYALRWLPQVVYFLSDEGPLPRACVLRDQVASRYGLCLYMLNGFSYFGLAGLILQIACGLALIREKHRLAATWLGWLTLQSFLVRAPWAGDNGAHLLAMTLLWFGLVGSERLVSGPHLNAGTVALTLQALASSVLLEIFLLGRPAEGALALIALLTLFPHRYSRGLGLICLAALWLLLLIQGPDRGLAVVGLAGLLPLVPLPQGEPSQQPAPPPWWTWLLASLLVYSSLAASSARLLGTPLSRPVLGLSLAMGLEQVWTRPYPPTRYEIEARYFGGVSRRSQSETWPDSDRARHLDSVVNDRTGWLSSRYHAYLARLLKQELQDSALSEVRIYRVDGPDQKVLLREWSLPTKP